MIWLLAGCFIWQAVGVAATVYYDHANLSRMGIATMMLHLLIGSYIGPFLLIQPHRL